MAGQITHFEIYGDHPDQLSEFYGKLFGWQMNKLEGLNYWRIHPEADNPEKVGGGLTYRPQTDPKGWLQFVSVDSIDDSLALAMSMGATVTRPKTAVPRTAWVAVLVDPAGNAFAIWQPDPNAFPLPEPD